MQKKQKKLRIPKNIKLNSAIASYVDSEMDYGEGIGMTKLAKSLEIDGSHPHKDTVTDKIDDFDIMQEALTEILIIRDKEGSITQIVKVKLNKIDTEQILNEIKKLKEVIKELKKQ